MLSVKMLSAIMPSFTMLTGIMPSVLMLSFIILAVIMITVVMSSVVAPFWYLYMDANLGANSEKKVSQFFCKAEKKNSNLSNLVKDLFQKFIST